MKAFINPYDFLYSAIPVKNDELVSLLGKGKIILMVAEWKAREIGVFIKNMKDYEDLKMELTEISHNRFYVVLENLEDYFKNALVAENLKDLKMCMDICQIGTLPRRV